MGLMLLDTPPGEHDIVLEFVTPLENQVGRVITLLTIAGIAWLFVIGFRRERNA